MELRAALLRLIGDDTRVSTGESVRRLHAGDLSGNLPRLPDAVVFPVEVEEVAAVLAFAHEQRVAVTCFGAGTSTDGHVIPVEGGISLDLSRLDRILSLSPDDHTISVQAGVPRSEANRRAGEHGLFFPVDPGADATLGGMAATNASGTTTVRYGNMRRQILGLTVVLADGSVVRTGGRTTKSSAGYDLTQLFAGSEGTLGAIVELTLRLYAIPDRVVAARATFAELDAACAAARSLAATGASVSRLELLDEGTVRAINAFNETTFTEAPSLFLEFSGSSAAVEEDAAFAREVMEEHGCLEVQLEHDHTARVRLWQARHDAAFAIAATRAGGQILSTDVCVPLSELPGAVRTARGTAERLGLEVAIVGHAGDGNYHVVLIYDPEDPDEASRADALKSAISADALARGGTCSGEHGIGLGKIDELATEHGDLLPLMRGIKRVLDPHGIMNPGKVFRP
jgi:D-lactate dehydrogenase (cytochrome)